MIRLLVLLFIGMFAAATIFGADHGQKRYGLMLADRQAAEAARAAAEAPAETVEVVEAPRVFIPAQPVMQPIEAAVRTVAAGPLPALTPTETAAPQPDAALPAPDIPGGTLFTVASRGANVRQGPGTTFAVLDSLVSGEQVLVVPEDHPIDGWSRVRLEGDGVEGYIATRLLLQSE